VQTSFVRAQERDEKDRREHRAHIKEHRLHRGVEKMHPRAIGETHLEVHRPHARRRHPTARNRESIVEKRHDWKQRRQDEERKPEGQNGERDPQRKGKDGDENKIEKKCHDPPRADARERCRRKLGRGDYRKSRPVKTASVAHLRTPPALLPDLRGPALPRRTSQRPTRRGRRCGHDNKGKQEPRLQTGNPAGSSQRLDPKVTHVTRNRGKVKKRYRPELDFV